MNKSIALSLIAVAMTGMSLSAAERHHTVTGNINGITVAKGAKVDYYPGAQSIDVVVSGPDKYIPLVQVVMKQGILYITLNNPDDSRKSIKMPKDLKITLKAPVMTTLHAQSSGSLKVKSTLDAGHKPMNVSASSSGSIDFTAISSTGNVTLDASSSGDIEIDDLRAANLSSEATSSGDIEIKNANVSKSDIKASSSGDISISRASLTEVNVKASSAGDIDIKGLSAKSLNVSCSSGADVDISGASDHTTIKVSSGADVDISDLRGGAPQVTKSSGGGVKMPK